MTVTAVPCPSALLISRLLTTALTTKHAYLRLMPTEGGKPKVIAYLYGGQGTINVPSWSPASRRIAFVTNSDL